MFETSTRPMGFMEIVNKVRSGKIRFDLEIQRRFCWNLTKQQEFIDSLIFGYRIPEISVVNKNDDYSWCLDGQQRSRTIERFYSDQFALSENIKNYEDTEGEIHKIAGLKFSELQEAVKIRLYSRTITECKYSNITEDEIREQFRRLNSGESMKSIEITRIDSGSEVIGFIKSISEMEFFMNKTKITDKAKVHFTDYEVILQALVLLTDRNIGFGGKDLQQFSFDLRDGMLDEELKTKVITITEYLNEAFPETVKYMKKTNIPMMFKLADKAMDQKIDAISFFEFVNTFFTELVSETEYDSKTQEGTASKGNIQRRLAILTSEFAKYFKEHEDKPIVTQVKNNNITNINTNKITEKSFKPSYNSFDREDMDFSSSNIPQSILKCAEYTMI